MAAYNYAINLNIFKTVEESDVSTPLFFLDFSRRGERLRLCLCRRMKPKDEASQSQLKG